MINLTEINFESLKLKLGWFICNHNVRREVKPLNVVGSIKVILLVAKYKSWRDVRPVNAVGSMKDILL